MKTKALYLFISVFLALSMVAAPGFAYDGLVTYSGQGITDDGFGGFILESEICGIENGAEVDGPYLLWVFTATKSENADITGPWGTAEMTKVGQGTFKYVSGWYELSSLVGTVFATFDGDDKNPQLVISHGCPPVEEAWCSPGYWRQTQHLDSWAATGFRPDELFSATVGFMPPVSKLGVTNGATTDPTLWQVLQAPQFYGGDAFNAVGDLLSGAHPDVNFLSTRVEDSCPLN
jgi:hypothetical protein